MAKAKKEFVADRIIMRGEATGHAHRCVTDTAEVWKEHGVLKVGGPDGAESVHEEHKPVTTTPGVTYDIGRVRELSPWDDAIRAVND